MIILKRENTAYLKIAILILLNVTFFSNGLIILYEKWFWWGSYYSHGPIVVIAFIWLVLQRVKIDKPALHNTGKNLSGIALICISIIFYLLGIWKNINIIAPWAICIFVVGNFVLFFGKNFVINNIGIFIYLLLAIPIPQLILDSLTFELNLFASYTSEILISFIFPSTSRDGNILQVNGHFISITHECSGLSNLISMFSIVWLMALFQKKKFISVIDYFISIPAAIISNILRIIIVTILVVNGYEQFALYDWHSEIGIIVFIVIVIMIAIFNDFPFNKNGFHLNISSSRLISLLNKNNKFFNTYIVLLIILSFVSFIIPVKKIFNNSGNEILLKNKIPNSIGRWESKNEILGENYYNILGTNDLLMRAYWENGNNTKNDKVYLFIIRSKNNSSAFHRSEGCLRGEGYELTTHDEINLKINYNTIPVHRQLFIDEDEGLLVYYWYYLNGRNIKSSIKYQLLFLLNINEKTSGSFIRISKPVNLNKIPQEEQKIKRFANKVIPEILEYL